MSGASGPYTIGYDPKALEELAQLGKPVARRVVRAVGTLASDPRPSGSQALVGLSDLLRLRVGTYQMIYTVEDNEVSVLVLRVAHRSEAYRQLRPSDASRRPHSDALAGVEA